MAKKKKVSKKTTAKQRESGQFQKGNKIGHRFKKGDPGGPGRPPLLGSPRAQLKRYAEEVAPEKLRYQLKKMIPDLAVDDISWAEVIALAHLLKAAQGDMAAITQIYKQADDNGASREKHDVTISDDAENAADEFASGVARLAARIATRSED